MAGITRNEHMWITSGHLLLGHIVNSYWTHEFAADPERLSLGWYDEGASIMLAWLTYYGAALAALKRAHIGFPGLVNAMPPAVRVPVVLLGEAVFQDWRNKGARLAELQLRVLLEEMHKRRMRVNVVGEVQRVRANFVHGFRKLEVEVTEF